MRRLIVRAAFAALGICVPAAALADGPPAQVDATRARAEISSSVIALDGTTQRVRALLRRARSRDRDVEVACLDGTLSRADVAARYGRDHAKRALDAWRVGDVASARQEMMRLAWRREASHEASVAADACAPPEERVVVREGTSVRVWIDPSLPSDVLAYP